MSQFGVNLLSAPCLPQSCKLPAEVVSAFGWPFVALGRVGFRQSRAQVTRGKVTLTCFRAPSGPKEQDRGLAPARALLRVEDEDFWSEAEGDVSCSVPGSIMEQINGPLQMEHALLFTFLEVSSDCNFKDQLRSLQSQQIMLCQGNDDDELQTDGNRSGHFQNGLAQTNEEVIRIIAAQLAEIGDQFDREIQEGVVNSLARHFLNENLSNEEITQHMSRAVRELTRAIPSDMEQEKAMLVLTMVLTKKIVNTVPALLRRVFNTTLNYMNQQFHNYIAEMLGE
ncbi:BH3-interacting domain death agonist isoform X1 [Vidua chalybeata]|uniref:BH3-interacting domain death agonist isoform X1 n=2 Tax=Vidua chalybeata TaxID=81927 RepID=UPI0023A8211E|nr:BH3-interacting domain death agonist isoform X1 [Vidua chalybeata]